MNYITGSKLYTHHEDDVARNAGPLTYVALLWALPCPHNLAVGSDWELPHAVGCHESRRLSFQVSESELGCNIYKSSKQRFMFIVIVLTCADY